MTKLNLGSSGHTIPDFLNVDVRPLPGVNIVADLNRSPWPWRNDSVDEVFCAHTLEHLDDPIAAMREIRRILKPNGRVTVIVPNGAGYMAHYPGHKHLFSETWFYCFADSDDNQEDLTGLFTEAKVTLHLLHHRTVLPGVIALTIRLWERLFNISRQSQIAWETLGVLVPGEVRFEAVKKGTKQ